MPKIDKAATPGLSLAKVDENQETWMGSAGYADSFR